METFAQWYVPDWDAEMGKTRKLLAAVPDDKLDWRPHPKSMPIGKLAGHVGDLAGWPSYVVDRDELAILPGQYKMLTLEPGGSKAFLAGFDEKAAKSSADVSAATDDYIRKNWKLSFGGHVVVDLPRSQVLRDVCLHHLIHHRAQLTVYLRLMDVKVPGLYGPSADEQ